MPIIDMFWDEILPDAIKGCDINNPQHVILMGLKKLHKQLVEIEDKLEEDIPEPPNIFDTLIQYFEHINSFQSTILVDDVIHKIKALKQNLRE